MTDAEQLEAVVATELERMQRLQHLGDFNTAGPSPAPEVIDVTPVEHPKWTDGRWIGAKWMAAHPGRVGGPISPFATVVHTTDMLPGEFHALIGRWQLQVADGACAHFVIGRSADDGVIQLVSTARNGQHAGGPQCGRFSANGRHWHPNIATVGIEIHCAGSVRLVGGAWRLVEDGKAHGEALPVEDVIVDPQRPGRGWHRVTDYQYEQLAALLADLEHVLAPLPAGCVAESLYEQPAPWSKLPSARVVGHHNLDARNRDDPHQPTYDWLRAYLRPAPTAIPGGGVSAAR